MRIHVFCQSVLIAGAVGAIGACKSDKTPVQPHNVVACGSGGTLQLAPLTAAVADCSNGGTGVTLAASGASYLVVPQFATSGVANQLQPYTLSVSSGAMAAVAAQVGRSGSGVGDGAPALRAQDRSIVAGAVAGQPGWRQSAFDAALRTRERQALKAGAWQTNGGNGTSGQNTRAAVRGPSLQVGQPPAVGSLRTFHVLQGLSTTAGFKTVAARLDYVGQNILIYIDTLAPANGFSPSQITAFGNLFDQTLYPLDVNTFGQPSDIDQNGRLIMLLSPVVNAITPAKDCSTQGFVAGFFFGNDLFPSNQNSNQGEIFYSLVPDPGATVSCAHTVNDLLNTTPATFLHELQHLISFSQHVIVHGQQNGEEGWLDEGMSIVAEELGSIYYEQKFPPPTGRSNPNQVFPDSAEGFISGLLFDSYSYLLKTDTVTVTLHSDSDGGLAWRGGDWLLVRWLGDQKGPSFYKTLESSNLTGTANIAAAAGEPFASLFADFSLSLYTDSIPGVAKSAIPSRDRFAARTLRYLYAALFNAVQRSGGSPDVPRAFPILTTTIAPGGTVTASMVPGTMSFYRLDTPASATSVQVQFSGSGGAALPSTLQPQVSVFRVPPGSP